MGNDKVLSPLKSQVSLHNLSALSGSVLPEANTVSIQSFADQLHLE
jgi:hypothetical protein